jgi:hypothetical protein
VWWLAAFSLAALGAAFWLRTAPRDDRAWALDHARPPEIEMRGGEVRIFSLRNFRHAPGGVSQERYREEVLRAQDARAVWFVLAPFAQRLRGLAHGFVSFEFEGGRFVSVSVEARREWGERYGLVGGLLRQFELLYVVGTEEDLIGLRALRGDTLFAYPTVATPEQAERLFLDMMERARALRGRPELYNTLTNNCMTNLRAHVNHLAPEPLPWGWGIILPGFSDEWALRRGLLATSLSLEEARARFRVDGRARAALGSGESFSAHIREGM